MSIRWQTKAAVQAMLSVVPFGESLNHTLQRTVTRAFTDENLLKSYRVQVQHVVKLNARFPLANRVVLEIGPGWYSIAGVLFWLLGTNKLYWVDTRRNFKHDLLIRYVHVLLTHLAEVSETLAIDRNTLEEKLHQLIACRRDTDYFGLCNIDYHAPGDARQIAGMCSEVDLVYSYGVLEHIPWDVLRDIFVGSKQIRCAGGRHYHNIGLHDHFHSAGLGNGVNFLRYSNWAWQLIAGNRFAYHNRKRRSDYLALIDALGFVVTFEESELRDINLAALDALPLHPDFQHYDRVDLAYSHLFVEFQ